MYLFGQIATQYGVATNHGLVRGILFYALHQIYFERYLFRKNNVLCLLCVVSYGNF
jgi:hypothetical protein